jgi:hypothetical protein
MARVSEINPVPAAIARDRADVEAAVDERLRLAKHERDAFAREMVEKEQRQLAWHLVARLEGGHLAEAKLYRELLIANELRLQRLDALPGEIPPLNIN